MTFKRFEELLKTKHPLASACAHGKFATTEDSKQVEINFKPNSKCYLYYGSYQDILFRVGVPCLYKIDIVRAEKRLAELKENHGKPNPFSLFKRTPMDNSKEIADMEKYLKDIEDGKYIMID